MTRRGERPFLIVSLAALGLVELLIRFVAALVLGISIIGVIVLLECDLNRLLRPTLLDLVRGLLEERT